MGTFDIIQLFIHKFVSHSLHLCPLKSVYGLRFIISRYILSGGFKGVGLPKKMNDLIGGLLNQLKHNLVYNLRFQMLKYLGLIQSCVMVVWGLWDGSNSFNSVHLWPQSLLWNIKQSLKRISLRKRFQFTVLVWSWQPQNVCTILTHFHRKAYRRGLSFLRSKKYLNAAIYPSVLPSLLDIFVIWVWRNGKPSFKRTCKHHLSKQQIVDSVCTKSGYSL